MPYRSPSAKPPDYPCHVPPPLANLGSLKTGKGPAKRRELRKVKNPFKATVLTHKGQLTPAGSKYYKSSNAPPKVVKPKKPSKN
ncbi:MAG: hypothetical protein QXZ13_01710 [Candidatus Diapherotrites archaeon]